MPQVAFTPCEFFVIRLAPDPIRAEPVNIGVALFSASTGGFVGVRLNPDWSRVQKLAPGFDPNDLSGLEADLLERLHTAAPVWRSREYFLQLAQESFSHCLQLTAPTAVLTSDPAAELDRLYRQYAAPLPHQDATVPAGARRRILHHLQRVFAEERILPHLQRRVRAGDWLGRPDQFRFDFAYREASGLRHVIQAAPLNAPESSVKAFCFTVTRLRRALGELDAAAFTSSESRPPVAGEGTAGAPLEREPSGIYASIALHRDLLSDAGVRVLDLSEAASESMRIRRALEIP